jgi:uncharacterized protein YpiB (UPF0302 family)
MSKKHKTNTKPNAFTCIANLGEETEEAILRNIDEYLDDQTRSTFMLLCKRFKEVIMATFVYFVRISDDIVV